MENIYKNKLHIEPSKGLLNDPNGLAYYKGKYFVFYQWNRFKLDHSHKEWGLFTSTDLIHWEDQGSALLPDNFYDKNGVYSGGAAIKDNELHLFYTGNVKLKNRRKSYQCHAILSEENTYVKQNTYITTPSGYTEHFRDPCVSKIANHWQMLVGAQSIDDYGSIAIFTSDDLKKWEYKGDYLKGNTFDQMCECPNLVDFKKHKVLLVCPQKRNIASDCAISSYSAYMVGTQKNNRFISETSLKKVDEGFDFYAPQVFEDGKGRKLMIAWMSRMSDFQEKSCPTRRFGYINCLTIPRQLILKGKRLYQKPLEEYENSSQTLKIVKSLKFQFKMSKNFEIYKFTPGYNADFKIDLFNGCVCLNYQSNKLTVLRKDWSKSIYNKKVLHDCKINQIEFYCDRSALEIFINNGETTMSMRFFCNSDERENIFISTNQFKLKIKSLNI